MAGSRSAYSLANQLKVDPTFGNVGFEDIKKVISKIRNEWNMASICDIVLNHTGNESLWLAEHPESTYSCYTSRHLRPAFLLDAMLTQIGRDISNGLLEMDGVPRVIENDNHIQALRHQLYTKYLPKINVHEFYQVNIEQYVAQFLNEIRGKTPSQVDAPANQLSFNTDPDYHRKGVQINMNKALEIYNKFHPDCYDEESRVRKCAEIFRGCLEAYNTRMKAEIDGHMQSAVENALAGVRYERVQQDGPQVRVISHQYPVFVPYFTQDNTEGKTLKEIEEMMYGNEGKFFMAHNGWVMNCDPLNDFARLQPGTGNVYLRRELIAWGDSVKLRYGDKPEDSPYLWKHMKEYVDTTAEIFDGASFFKCKFQLNFD